MGSLQLCGEIRRRCDEEACKEGIRGRTQPLILVGVPAASKCPPAREEPAQASVQCAGESGDAASLCCSRQRGLLSQHGGEQ